MFVDTSGLFCFLEPRASFHDQASLAFQAAPRLRSHNYVLAELVTLVHSRNGNRIRALEFLRDFLGFPGLQFTWVDQEIHDQAVDLLHARLDKTYSLCDAVSFVLMRQHGIHEALSTDHHFEQEGFQILLT